MAGPGLGQISKKGLRDCRARITGVIGANQKGLIWPNMGWCEHRKEKCKYVKIPNCNLKEKPVLERWKAISESCGFDRFPLFNNNEKKLVPLPLKPQCSHFPLELLTVEEKKFVTASLDSWKRSQDESPQWPRSPHNRDPTQLQLSCGAERERESNVWTGHCRTDGYVCGTVFQLESSFHNWEPNPEECGNKFLGPRCHVNSPNFPVPVNAPFDRNAVHLVSPSPAPSHLWVLRLFPRSLIFVYKVTHAVPATHAVLALLLLPLCQTPCCPKSLGENASLLVRHGTLPVHGVKDIKLVTKSLQFVIWCEFK